MPPGSWPLRKQGTAEGREKLGAVWFAGGMAFAEEGIKRELDKGKEPAGPWHRGQ